MMGHGGGMMLGGMSMMMWPWMILLAALAVAALVALILVIIRLAQDRQRGARANDSGRRILDERYARGEIDHDEYHRRRDALARPGT